MKKTTEWDRTKLRVERKRFKMLALLNANKELFNNALLSELHQSDRRYYKLLKKYKSLKKDNKEFRGLIEDWALVESDEPTRRAMLEAIGSEVKE